jgi:hypothetical protein
MLMSHPGALTVSDRCYWLRWEIESFVTDEEGRYPDKNNHLIDSFKYLMQATGWRLMEQADVNLPPDHNGLPQQSQSIAVEDWSDNVVEKSLWVDANDIYSEYFN